MKNTLQTRSGSVGFGFSVLLGLLGIACSDSTLTSPGLLDSAAGGAVSSGGTTGSGGSAGGEPGNFGGAGGTNSSGTGGKAAGGSGGTTCPSIDCAPLNCPNGTMPNPSNPCGCAVCAPSDAGVSKDASPDVCWALPCAPEICPTGQVAVERPCSCPICVAPDAGQADAPVCPRTCPAVRCAYGTVRDSVCGCTTCLLPDGGPEAGGGSDAAKDSSVDVCLALPCALPLCAAGYSIVDHACGCPTCEPSDAGVDSGKLACVGLDECACMASDSCSVVSDACYCPFPQCGSGACVCGGGKFLGCVPAGLNTCAAAKARVASLCPTLKGPTFDGLCQQTDAACITKCLDDVTACSDVSCSFCEACDCVSDPFARCVSTCKSALKQ